MDNISSENEYVKSALVMTDKEELRLGYKAFLELRGFLVHTTETEKCYDLLINHTANNSFEGSCIFSKKIYIVSDGGTVTQSADDCVILKEFITAAQLEEHI